MQHIDAPFKAPTIILASGDTLPPVEPESMDIEAAVPIVANNTSETKWTAILHRIAPSLPAPILSIPHAISAILFGEIEGPAFLRALASPERKFMSAFTRLETSIVVESRKGNTGTQALAELMATGGIDTVPFDTGQAELALDAWRRYGKGRHPAGLNLGDCAAYALVRFTGEPLLYKGDDFSRTDVAGVVCLD